MARLGGQAEVARRLGVTRAAVSQWVAADAVPVARRIDLWRLAVDGAIEWTPPGAEGLRDKLRVQAERAA